MKTDGISIRLFPECSHGRSLGRNCMWGNRVLRSSQKISLYIWGHITRCIWRHRSRSVFRIHPLLTAIIFSVFSSSILGIISKKAYQREDTLIGAMWAIGMAFGIFMIYQTPGYVPDLASYLFGNILTVSRIDILIMVALNLIIALIVFIRYNEFLAFSFDEEFSEVTNVPVLKTYIVLLSLVALTVVVLVSVVGIILAMALLTLPAATASIFTNSLKKMIVFSVLIGVGYMLIGIGMSFFLNQPSGATIVLVSGISYLGILGIKSLIRK